MKNTYFLFMLLLIPACASVGATQLQSARPRADDCKLDVYSSETEITRPWETVCMIDSRTGTTAFADKTASAAIKNAKPKACKCGADAIVIQSMDTEGVTLVTWGKGKAIVKGIRYK